MSLEIFGNSLGNDSSHLSSDSAVGTVTVSMQNMKKEILENSTGDTGTAKMYTAASRNSARSKRLSTQVTSDPWREIIKFVEPYLDVFTMLMLRQTNRFLYCHKYRPAGGILCFHKFRGYDPEVIWNHVLLSATRAVHSSVRDALVLDFSNCTLLKDTSVARIMDAVHGDGSDNVIRGRIKGLIYDFCYQITDKGLSAMLTTHLPYLEKLTMRSARSKLLTGLPFKTDLCVERWPKFTHFNCSFSNMWLEPVGIVARFIMQMAAETGTTPTMSITGSWASKCLLERLHCKQVAKLFDQAVKTQNLELVSKLPIKFAHDLRVMSQSEEWEDSCLVQLVKSAGSELLVNSPVTVETSEDGGVDVWTLPLSIAISSLDHDTVRMLLRRGAKVDVWDYLGKSPLFRACEVENKELVALLFSYGASPVPHDLNGLSSIDISIKKRNTAIVKLLLERGAVLDYSCPALRTYKSPLYIACEAGAPDIVLCLLRAGANPNWKSHTNFTPTLLAYQLQPRWLPYFLDCGAGAPPSRRWILSELLSCAIMKEDMDTAVLLVSRNPDILHRVHHMWSIPHIQAARFGRYHFLSFFLDQGCDVNAQGNDGQAAIHAAAEEGHLDCVALLLVHHADINKCDHEGFNALHIACLEHRLEVSELLLRGGCNANVHDNSIGETPLMTCIRTRDIEMAHLILESAMHLNCNEVDAHGGTALMYAMFFGQYWIADQLMARGAETGIIDSLGNSPYSISCERLLTHSSDRKILRKYIRLYKEGNRKNDRSVVSSGKDVVSGAHEVDLNEDGEKILCGVLPKQISGKGSRFQIGRNFLPPMASTTLFSNLKKKTGVTQERDEVEKRICSSHSHSDGGLSSDSERNGSISNRYENVDAGRTKGQFGQYTYQRHTGRSGTNKFLKKFKIEPKSALAAAKFSMTLFKSPGEKVKTPHTEISSKN